METKSATHIVYGPLGDCSHRAGYAEFEMQLLREGRIGRLIFVDVGQLRDNVLGTPTKEDILRLMDASKGRLVYYDFDKPQDRATLSEERGIDVCFIVTPNHTHCPLSMFSLPLLSEKGIIVVEKPFAEYGREGVNTVFELTMQKRLGRIFGFDHYLSKAEDAIYHLALEQLANIGAITRISFFLEETLAVPRHRIRTLNRGMAHDLAVHGLSILFCLASAATVIETDDIRHFTISKVKAAQYPDCGIQGHTYVQIEAEMPWGAGSIPVLFSVGKAMAADRKALVIEGAKGVITLDFTRMEYRLEIRNSPPQILGTLRQKHTIDMINHLTVTPDKFLTAPGIQAAQTALQILLIVEEICGWIQKMYSYPPASTREEILEQIAQERVVRVVPAA